MSQPKSQSNLQVLWITDDWIFYDILCMDITTEPKRLHRPDTFMALGRVLTAEAELQRWVFEGEALMPSEEFVFLGHLGCVKSHRWTGLVITPLVLWDSGKSSLIPSLPRNWTCSIAMWLYQAFHDWNMSGGIEYCAPIYQTLLRSNAFSCGRLGS